MNTPSVTTPRSSKRSLEDIAQLNFNADMRRLHVRIDRMFAGLLVLQWLMGIAAAMWISPTAWDGAESYMHPHLTMAVLGGGVLVSLPLLLAVLYPGAAVTRQVIAASQVLFSSLLIHLTGGRIETHFHIFGSLAFIAAYRDWKLFPTTTLIIAADHYLRGVFWPASIFGVTLAPQWLWLEHGAWVGFEVLLLLVSIRQSIREMWTNARQSAQLDDALRQVEASERRFRAGFEQSAMGMAVKTMDGAYLEVNDRYCEITGYSREELFNKRFEDVTHPDDLSLHSAAMEQLLSGEVANFQIDKRYIHKKGHAVWVRLTLSLVTDENGHPDHLIAAAQDITTERAAQQELAKLSLVASKTRHSVIISGPTGIIEWVNDGFTRLTGYTAEEAIGRQPGELLQGPDTSEVTAGFIRQELQAQRVVSVEILNYHKNKKPYWISLEIDPVLNEQGELIHFVATQTDITGRKKRAQALEEATRAAKAANEAKSLFLANMSHEIRTPLNGILGFADLLARDQQCTVEEQQDYVHTIRTSGKHLLMLINDILDLSKIEAGQLQIELAPCSPHHVLAEVTSVLRVKAQEKGLNLEYGWTTPIPVLVNTDASRLKQLLMNLVGNAIKFTERGAVNIVARYEVSGDKAQTIFEVQDTGVGVAADKLETIFKPFSQADETVTRRFGGTGLGLTISRSIALKLGGNLTVESTEGVGSTFTATIDAGDPAGIEVAESIEIQSSSDVSQHIAATTHLDGVHVLVVDDGHTNRKLISLVLRRANAIVATAENGAQAVEAAARQTFDVILMDMQMPVMDGYTATRRLRDAGNETPVIALTAHAMKGDRQRCEEAGCSGYLSKPVDSAELLKLLAGVTTPAPTTANMDGAATAPATNPSTATSKKHRSQLPVDDPEIRAIVEEFIATFDERLQVMSAALASEDFETLTEQAHWLKGAGGTVGFGCLTGPAGALEERAKDRDLERAREMFKTVTRIKDNLEV